jgi:hypothetical protein
MERKVDVLDSASYMARVVFAGFLEFSMVHLLIHMRQKMDHG